VLKKLVVSALFAGVAAGLVAALLQFAFVQPILLEAELYESGQAVHSGNDASAEHDHAGHDHSASTGAGGGWVRNSFSLVFSVFTYVGYALVLMAVFAFTETRGIAIAKRSGWLWGLAGFAAAQFAPALGLAPELPGNAGADLVDRQIWWLATLLLTAVGLWLIAFGNNRGLWALGAVAALAPHLIGAPQPTSFTGPAPPELAALYATRALGTGLIAWVVLGVGAAYFWQQENSAETA